MLTFKGPKLKGSTMLFMFGEKSPQRTTNSEAKFSGTAKVLSRSTTLFSSRVFMTFARVDVHLRHLGGATPIPSDCGRRREKQRKRVCQTGQKNMFRCFSDVFRFSVRSSFSASDFMLRPADRHPPGRSGPEIRFAAPRHPRSARRR